jgi:HSP20 family molecular chaperone IbpA
MISVPHSLFPRSLFGSDTWHNDSPSTLDFFDAFDELDHNISKNLDWLSKPEFMPQCMMPKVPQKYRIVFNVAGYSPKSITTEAKGHRVLIQGKEKETSEKGTSDFSTKEFKRTFNIPPQSIVEKMVSFITGSQLVIEVPLHETSTHPDSDLIPKIMDREHGEGKMVTFTFRVPASIPMERCSITIKDRDLIIKAEDVLAEEKKGHIGSEAMCRFYYYKRTTMPENTDFKNLQCKWDNHKLTVTAPIDLQQHFYKKVQIQPEWKK